MKQEIVAMAQNIIDNRRRELERDFEEKMKPLYLDENFVSLNKAYARLVIENARCEAFGEKCDKAEEEKLKKQLDEIKQKNGVSEIKYHCPKCKDSGKINGQYCTCLKKEISNILLKESGFENLNSFDDAKFSNETTKLLYDKMKQWCHGDFKKNIITIGGQTGVGKTYLTKCMANELIELGKVVKMVTAYSLNQDFQEAYKKKNDSILEKYFDVDVLFIDDLGTEPIYNNVTENYVYILINERRIRKLPTIITTNLTIDEIGAKYSERILSRLCDKKSSINIFLNGDDIRIKK